MTIGGTKEGGLIRQLSSISKPRFHPCTVVRQPRPIPEDVPSCRWLADDSTLYYRTEGGGGGGGGGLRETTPLFTIYTFLLPGGLCTQISTAGGYYRACKIFAISKLELKSRLIFIIYHISRGLIKINKN